MKAAESIVRPAQDHGALAHGRSGLDWVTADEEAARLEHAVSEVVERRLYEALGRPQTCPHGNPIPGHSKAVAREVRLASLESRRRCRRHARIRGGRA